MGELGQLYGAAALRAVAGGHVVEVVEVLLVVVALKLAEAGRTVPTLPTTMGLLRLRMMTS